MRYGRAVLAPDLLYPLGELTRHLRPSGPASSAASARPRVQVPGRQPGRSQPVGLRLRLSRASPGTARPGTWSTRPAGSRRRGRTGDPGQWLPAGTWARRPHPAAPGHGRRNRHGRSALMVAGTGVLARCLDHQTARWTASCTPASCQPLSALPSWPQQVPEPAVHRSRPGTPPTWDPDTAFAVAAQAPGPLRTDAAARPLSRDVDNVLR
jgi:hypothetical protein